MMNSYFKKQTDIKTKAALTDVILMNDYMVKCINTFNSLMGIKPPVPKEEIEQTEEKK